MSQNNKEIFSKNLNCLMNSKGVDRNQLCSDLNLKYTTVRDWQKGITYPRIGKIELLANYFNVNKSDLIENKTSTPLSSSPTPKILELDRSLKEPHHGEWISYGDKLLEQQNTVEDSKNTVVELFSYNYYDHAASAGTGQYLNDVQVETIELPVDYDADFVIPVYGDSMEPDYHSGDYVFVKLSVELTDGDIGVFEYYGDAYIKQLLIHAEGAFLHSLNDKYSDIQIDRDSDFRIIGKVVGNFMPKEY
ncbi:TPA: helix-turn-helix transcriptional regulator [Streptococcus agalactiae]|nr:helix-turn-helix transcriptional regulator [Streptococcus agalactiae]HEN0451948.1 helix-turn-helix transcriptional regulator [Streptococcus agalactiae]HEN0737459.1 helix-turn-helix transcriptional regulator [Streptococcus agalactiae]HEN1031945.1 helix-turn-helix transcriptional regulator [Streptococcus agalactiae]HEN1054946.1 helix-turn-helix transcriptional regulator [Streptococcus agalactiae]